MSGTHKHTRRVLHIDRFSTVSFYPLENRVWSGKIAPLTEELKFYEGNAIYRLMKNDNVSILMIER